MARNTRRKSSAARGYGLKNTWSEAWNVIQWKEENQRGAHGEQPGAAAQGLQWESAPEHMP